VYPVQYARPQPSPALFVLASMALMAIMGGATASCGAVVGLTALSVTAEPTTAAVSNCELSAVDCQLRQP
jgi:hypothetical protein